TGVFQHVEKYFPQLVRPRHHEMRLLGATQLPLDVSLPHPLQRQYVADHRRGVYAFRGREICGGAAILAEGARDCVEAVDLRQNTSDILLEHGVEVLALVAPRTAQMLHPEPDRGERI